LKFIFTLADRWGEPDPRKIADLPANIITYWEAYFDLMSKHGETPPDPVPQAESPPSPEDEDFAACFRILGNG